MKYDVITIDTNIFRENGYKFSSGILGQLTQFKNGTSEFVLSEVVLSEIKTHLVDAIEPDKKALISALKKGVDKGIVPADQEQKVEEICSSLCQSMDLANETLNKFIEATGASIVSVENTNLRNIVDAYFEPTPPFEKNEKKKNEFPDAIALHSLEEWAQAEKKKLLIISKDQGWAKYAEQSKFMDCMDDLATALELLQENLEKAEQLITEYLDSLELDENKELLSEIKAEIAAAIEANDVFAIAQGPCYVEPSFATFSEIQIDFHALDDDFAFRIVRIGSDRIVIEIDFEVNATASVVFEFSVWDSIDREYVSMGGYDFAQDFEFDASALLTFIGDFSADKVVLELEEVELTEGAGELDFGDVEFPESFYG